jgi:hypothetical protein
MTVQSEASRNEAVPRASSVGFALETCAAASCSSVAGLSDMAAAATAIRVEMTTAKATRPREQWRDVISTVFRRPTPHSGSNVVHGRRHACKGRDDEVVNEPSRTVHRRPADRR